jgi:hypothetical protein
LGVARLASQAFGTPGHNADKLAGRDVEKEPLELGPDALSLGRGETVIHVTPDSLGTETLSHREAVSNLASDAAFLLVAGDG